jgi:pimeloyl-ACP methyl ester carboxylesterase
MSKTKDTEASISISRPNALGEAPHMEFEHVTFDLPHGTFHALQGGDPDGQPTIVLHGFPDHPPTAKPFLTELGRRGRHVVAPWLRGYAPSPTAGPFDFAALTSDVLALIDRWSPGRAVELVGHDWGALIRYDACVTAPERIERAVTLAVPHPLTFLSRRRKN